MKNYSLCTHKNFLIALLGATCLTPFSGPAFANTTDRWISSSGNWSNASNWSAGVPNSSTVDVIIPQSKSGNPIAVTYRADGEDDVGGLTVGVGNTLSIYAPSSKYTTSLYVNGTLANSGTIQLGETKAGQDGYLYVGNTTDGSSSGNGTIIMGSAQKALGYIRGISGTITFTNNNNTIEGQGFIGDTGNFSLANKSTIDANFSGKSLTIGGGTSGAASNVATHNVGLLEATNGGTLIIYGNVDNTIPNTKTKGVGTYGTIGAADGSIYINDDSVTHQTLTSTGSGEIYTGGKNGVHFNGVTIGSNSTVDASGNLYVDPAFVNQGTLLVEDGSTLFFTDSTSLTGGGTVSILGPSADVERYVSPGTKAQDSGYTLTNTDNTIEGSGSFGKDAVLNFVNGPNGTLIVNGGALSFGADNKAGSGSFTNNGAVTINNGSTLSIQNHSRAYVQNSGTTKVDGTLSLSRAGLTLNGGTLEGAAAIGPSSVSGGTINGNVVNNGGTIHPGDAGSTWGDLLIIGNLTEKPNGTMDFTLTADQNPGNHTTAALADFLEVTGRTTLDGTLNISPESGVKLSANELFPLIASFGLYSGDFANFSLNGTGCSANGTDSWRCQLQSQLVDFKTITNGNIYELEVANVSSVPLPAALPLFGTGVFAVGALARRKRR
jgi:hypothetical protein